MPKNPKVKIANPAEPNLPLSENLSRAGIFKIDKSGRIMREHGAVALFLLNPESWEENKSANWIPHSVPGQSDPVYQWVSSGPRKVSFQALVTRETSDFSITKIASGESQGTPKLPTALTTALPIVGRIASAFAKTSNTTPVIDRPSTTGRLDISDMLNYYRSLLYPVYDNPSNPRRLVQSPPMVSLFTGSALSKIENGDLVNPNSDTWIVTNIRIRVTKQLPNLAPMEAQVNFELTQYNIRSFSEQRFTRFGR